MMEDKGKIIYKNVLGTLFVNSTDNYKELYGYSGNCREGIIIKKVLEQSPLFGKVEEGDVICSVNNGKKHINLIIMVNQVKRVEQVKYLYLILLNVVDHIKRYY